MAIYDRHHSYMVVTPSILNGINPQVDAVFVSSGQNMACTFFPSRSFFTGWFYKLALLDFELIFEVKMQEREGV